MAPPSSCNGCWSWSGMSGHQACLMTALMMAATAPTVHAVASGQRASMSPACGALPLVKYLPMWPWGVALLSCFWRSVVSCPSCSACMIAPLMLILSCQSVQAVSKHGGSRWLWWIAACITFRFAFLSHHHWSNSIVVCLLPHSDWV